MQAARRKPVPSKGHAKTRGGCFTCKRRRVKCSETRPECRACVKLGLACNYPQSALPPRIATTSANLDHLRFFRHFLTEAHPHGRIWDHVAALSHEYEFLAHAVLALAAQHLTLFAGQDHSLQALDLRVAAMAGLNTALSQPCRTPADADARYAAAVALTYQSAYMRDAMMDFVVLLRGWMQIQTRLGPGLATELSRGAYTEYMRQRVSDGVYPGDGGVLEGYVASLRTVRPLCRGVAELRYLAALERLGAIAKESPLQGE